MRWLLVSLQSYRVLSDCKYKNIQKKKKKKWKIRKKKKSVFNFGVDPLHLILRPIVMPSPTGSTQILILGSAARALLSVLTQWCIRWDHHRAIPQGVVVPDHSSYLHEHNQPLVVVDVVVLISVQRKRSVEIKNPSSKKNQQWAEACIRVGAMASSKF